MKKGIFSKGISVLLSVAMVATMLVPGGLIASAADYSSLLSHGGTLSGAKGGTTLTKTVSQVGTSKDFDITLNVKGADGSHVTTPTDIVLVLDTSGSMSAADLKDEKQAANDFLLDALGTEVSAAVVQFSDGASAYSTSSGNFVDAAVDSSGLTLADTSGDSYFSKNIADLGNRSAKSGGGNALSGALSKVASPDGSTFTQQALMYADALLKTRSSTHNKIVVLMTDGVPNYTYRITNTASLSPAISLGGRSYDFYGTAFQYADTGTGSHQVRAVVGGGFYFEFGSSYQTGNGKTVYDNGIATVSQAKLMHDSDGIGVYTVGYGIDGLTVGQSGGSTQQATDTLTQCAALGGGSFYKANKGAEGADLVAALNKIKDKVLYADAAVTDAIDENTFTYVGFVENGAVTQTSSKGATHAGGGSIAWSLPGYDGAETSITYRVTLKDTSAAPASSGTHIVAGSAGATTLNGTPITTGAQPWVKVGTGSITVVNYLVNTAGTPVTSSGTPTSGATDTDKIMAAQLGGTQSFAFLNLGSTVYSVPGLAGYVSPGTGYTLYGSAKTAKLTLDSPTATLYVPYTLGAGTVTVHYVDAGGNAIPGVSNEALPAGKAGDPISVPVSNINGNNRMTVSNTTATYGYAGKYKIGTGSQVTSSTIIGTYIAGAQDIYLYYNQTTGAVYVHHYRVNSSGAPVDTNGSTKDTNGNAYTKDNAAVQLPGDSVYTAAVNVGAAFGPASTGYATAVPASITKGADTFNLVPKTGGYTSDAVPANGQTVSLYVPYTLNANAVTVHYVDANGNAIPGVLSEALPAGKVGDPISVPVSNINGNNRMTVSNTTATYGYAGKYKIGTGSQVTSSTITGTYVAGAQDIYLYYGQTTGTVYVHHYRVNSSGAPVDASGSTKDANGNAYTKDSAAVQLPGDSVYTATVNVGATFGPSSTGYATAVPGSITKGADTFKLVPKTGGYKSGAVPANGQTVSLYVPYTLKAGTVTVHYVDASGNAIPGVSSEKLPAGKFGDPISVPVSSINGNDRTTVSNATATYTYTGSYKIGTGSQVTSNTITGTYIAGTQDIYLYYHQTTGTVYVHHNRVKSSGAPVDESGSTKDANGNAYTKDSAAVQLPGDSVYTATVNVGAAFGPASTDYAAAVPGSITKGTDTFNLVPKAGGYTSDAVPADGSTVALYVPYTLEAGAVTVHYVDANGNAIPGVSSEALPAGKLGDPISVPVSGINGNDRTTVSNATATYTYTGEYKVGTGSPVTSNTLTGTYVSGTQDIYLYYHQTTGTVYVHHYRVNSSGAPVDANGSTKDANGSAYTPTSGAVQLPDDLVYAATVPVGFFFGPESADYTTAVPGAIFKGTTEYDLIGKDGGYTSDELPGGGQTVSLYVPYRQNTGVTVSFIDQNGGGTIQADVTVPAGGPAAVGDPFSYTIPTTIQAGGYTYTYSGSYGSPISGIQTPEAQHFILNYKKNVTVTIHYHDVDNPDATFPQQTFSGFAGTGYTVPGVTGYEQVARDGSPTIGQSYSMVNENQSFDVYLRKGNYTYKVYYYLDSDPFTPFDSYDGPATVLGGKITSVPDKAPAGYQLDASQSTALPLTITSDPEQNVIYVYYSIVPLGNVTNITVHYYLKGTSTKVKDDFTDTGFVGDSATENAPTIAGYTISGPGSITIDSLVPIDNVITFYYTKDQTTPGNNNNNNNNNTTNNNGTVSIPDNQVPLASNPDTGNPYTSGLLLPLLASLLTVAGLRISRIIKKARRSA